MQFSQSRTPNLNEPPNYGFQGTYVYKLSECPTETAETHTGTFNSLQAHTKQNSTNFEPKNDKFLILTDFRPKSSFSAHEWGVPFGRNDFKTTYKSDPPHSWALKVDFGRKSAKKTAN